MRHFKQRGFTLIELVVVIAILGVIIAIGSRIISAGFTGYLSNKQVLSADAQIRVALERMQRDIRSIRSPADIGTNSNNSFAFTDTSGNLVTYSLSGTSLMRQTNSATAQILADGIASLTFTYYDRTGAVNTGANIRYVVVSLNVTQGGANFTVATGIYPRNLQ